MSFLKFGVIYFQYEQSSSRMIATCIKIIIIPIIKSLQWGVGVTAVWPCPKELLIHQNNVISVAFSEELWCAVVL